MPQMVKVSKPRQAKSIRTVTMRFDMNNENDAATYAKLSESALRSHRERRTSQAIFLLSVLFGVRKADLHSMGLDDLPTLLCLKCFHDLTKEIELEKAEAIVAAARNKPPSLRLIPEHTQTPISA